ncbi:MAG: hypothetical protein Q8880_12045, partial [Bacteroidota bacterium]|nr:hypothetical protein [Bacteroidota bacterium]
MFDFTLEVYKLLLKRLIEKGYLIVPFGEYILKKDSYNKVAIIRHDVDRLSELSLNIAEIENKLNIKTSYYYRIVKGSNNPDIIKKVSQLGHEIGYHYEDLTIAKGDYSKAIKMFEKNLAYFRQFYPVKTICMHGSPLSKLDNRKIWDKINYRDYGIIGEPYYETNFNKFLYLTDTGRRWNGDKFSIRDKVHNTYDFNF